MLLIPHQLRSHLTTLSLGLILLALTTCSGTREYSPDQAQPAALVAGIAALLPQPSQLDRLASQTQTDPKINWATDYIMSDLGGIQTSQNVAPKGMGLEFSPTGTVPDAPVTLADAAFAMFSFSMESFDGEPNIEVMSDALADDPGSVWLGVANYDDNNWRWFQLDGTETPLGTIDPYISEAGKLFCTILTAKNRHMRLAWVRLGGEVHIWDPEEVDGGATPVSSIHSLTQDLDGKPSIAYKDQTDDALKWAVREPDGTWTTTKPMPTAPPVADFTKIEHCFDNDNQPHFAYGSGFDGIFHIWRNSEGWHSDTISNVPFSQEHLSMIAGPDGLPEVVWVNVNNLVHSKWINDAWQMFVLHDHPTDTVGHYCHFNKDTFDGKFRRLIAYQNSTDNSIWAAINTGEGWITKQVSPPGEACKNPQICGDEQQMPTVMWINDTTGEPRIAQDDGLGGWVVSGLNDAPSGSNFSGLAVGSDKDLIDPRLVRIGVILPDAPERTLVTAKQSAEDNQWLWRHMKLAHHQPEIQSLSDKVSQGYDRFSMDLGMVVYSDGALGKLYFGRHVDRR